MSGVRLDQARDSSNCAILILRLNRSGVANRGDRTCSGLLVAVARRLIILNEGRVLSQGEPEAVVRDERVISAYLGGKAHHAAAS